MGGISESFGGEFLRRHPEWFVYRENGKVPWGILNVGVEDASRIPSFLLEAPVGHRFLGPRFNYLKREYLDFAIDQVIAGAETFGYDGVRFDGHFEISPEGYDINGQPLVKKETEDFTDQNSLAKEAQGLTRDLTFHMKRRVHEVLPGFLFMFNSFFRAGNRNSFYGDEINPDLIAQLSDSGAAANESVNDAPFSSSHRASSWEKLSGYMVWDVDACRKCGGYAYVWCPQAYKTCKELGILYTALVLATGDHPWFIQAHNSPLMSINKFYPDNKKMLAFATRFSSLIWGYGITREKEPENYLHLSSSKGNVWWKDYVNSRQLKDGRKYLIINLLAAPPDIFLDGKTQKLPEPVENISIKFKVPVKKTWFMSAYPKLEYQEVVLHNNSILIPKFRPPDITLDRCADCSR